MKKIVALTIAALFISTAVIYARPGHGQGYGKGGCEGCRHGKMKRGPHKRGLWFGNLERMKKRLDLTDEQVKKISAINADFKKQLEKSRETMKPKREEFRKLMMGETINLKDARALLREITDIKIDIRMTMIKHRLEIEKVLNKKQKEKLRAEKRKRCKRYGEKRFHKNN